MFARIVRKRMLLLGLRCFVDEGDLGAGYGASQAVWGAMRSTHTVVVLLSEQFFAQEALHQELRFFLKGRRQGVNRVIPVLLGMTVDKCMELARMAGLEEALELAAALESPRRAGKRKVLEETLQRIVKSVGDLMGARRFRVLLHRAREQYHSDIRHAHQSLMRRMRDGFSFSPTCALSGKCV